MDANTWLTSVVPKHERLTAEVVRMMENMLKNARIDYLGITGRTKSIDSASEKISRKQYRSPSQQLTDLSGIRVITFFESQVEGISNLVQNAFEIDQENSLDKSSLLGIDRLGYRSVHFVCELGKVRCGLAEYKSFDGLKFEIQIRTVLQHAWAELAHDRNYKFSGILPAEIQRRLHLYAGMLEIADSGFQELANQIDRYQNELASQSPETFLRAELNSLTLRRYIDGRLPEFCFPVLNLPDDDLVKVIIELRDFGIASIGDLDRLFTKQFITACNSTLTYSTNIGLPRDAMMFADLSRYFESAWKEKYWSGTDQETVDFLGEKYRIDEIEDVFRKNSIYVEGR